MLTTDRHAPFSKKKRQKPTHAERFEHDFAPLERLSFGLPESSAYAIWKHPSGFCWVKTARSSCQTAPKNKNEKIS
jgi:hypothetical protein